MPDQKPLTFIVVDRQDTPGSSIIRALYGNNQVKLVLTSRPSAQIQPRWGATVEINNKPVWKTEPPGSLTREGLLREVQQQIALWALADGK